MWLKPIFHLILQAFHFKKLDEAEAILEKWDPFLSDDSYISKNGWNMAQVESSIRNEKNKDLPWQRWLDIVVPVINNYLKDFVH